MATPTRRMIITSIPTKLLPLPPVKLRRIRVAAYCRVSTKYEEQLNSLNMQIKVYTKYMCRKSKDLALCLQLQPGNGVIRLLIWIRKPAKIIISARLIKTP